MRKLSVQVERDHLERLAVARSPAQAVAELVWNSLDADATWVEVSMRHNSIQAGIEEIAVSDNGAGIRHADALVAFEHLGGSWKREKPRTHGGRLLHGQQGKGRFQAFALGDRVVWSTRFRSVDGSLLEYRIFGHRSSLDTFMVEDPRPSREQHTGTVVRVSDVPMAAGSLERERARQTLTEQLALYLREYPDVTVRFLGEELDPAALEVWRDRNRGADDRRVASEG